jgi:hypothetical protein
MTHLMAVNHRDALDALASVVAVLVMFGIVVGMIACIEYLKAVDDRETCMKSHEPGVCVWGMGSKPIVRDQP